MYTLYKFHFLNGISEINFLGPIKNARSDMGQIMKSWILMNDSKVGHNQLL